MNSIRIKCLLLCLSGLISSPIFSATIPSEIPPTPYLSVLHPYFEAFLGHGIINKSGVDDGIAVSLRLGYQLDENIALETGYYAFPDEEFNSHAHGFDVAARLGYPLSPWADVYGRLGMGLTCFNHHQRLVGIAGVGGHYYLGSRVTTQAEFTYHSTNSPSIPSMYGFMLGLGYRF